MPVRDRLHRLLRSSERYTKTDMVYLAHGGFWLTVEQITMGLIAFLLSIAFAHFVSKDTYGTYRFLLSLYWTLTAFSLTGLSDAMARAVARGEEGAYRQSFKLSLLGNVPMSLLAAGLSAYYFLHGNAMLGWGLFLICLIGPLFQMGYLYGAFLEGKKEFRLTAIFGILITFAPAAALGLAMFFTSNPLVFFCIYLGGNAATGLALCAWTFKLYKPNNATSDTLMNLGGHFSVMNVLLTVSGQLDQLLVFHYIGAAPLAVYSFATALPDQIKSLLGNLTNISFPKFVKRPVAQILDNLWYRIFAFTALTLLLVLCYILLAPVFFEFFYPNYVSSVFYSQLYALALIPIGSLIPVTVLQAHAAKRELYAFNILSPLFQVAALFAGILWCGLLGVVIARIIGRVFNLLLSLVLVKWFARRSA
jgi:O-antigen/teichoic acid export membrane protein